MNENMMLRQIPAWGHVAYALGGLATCGWLWAAWLVHAIMNSQHNNGVRARQAAEAYAAWDREHGDAWRAHQAAQAQTASAQAQQANASQP